MKTIITGLSFLIVILSQVRAHAEARTMIDDKMKIILHFNAEAGKLFDTFTATFNDERPKSKDKEFICSEAIKAKNRSELVKIIFEGFPDELKIVDKEMLKRLKSQVKKITTNIQVVSDSLEEMCSGTDNYNKQFLKLYTALDERDSELKIPIYTIEQDIINYASIASSAGDCNGAVNGTSQAASLEDRGRKLNRVKAPTDLDGI